MVTRSALQESWALAVGRPAVSNQIRAFPIEGASHSARGAVSPSGDIGVLLELRAEEASAPLPTLQSRSGSALEVEVATFMDDRRTVRALAVWCRSHGVRDAFTAFCEALLGRAGGGVPIGTALEMCHAEFLRLLGVAGRLDDRVLGGLLGELLTLQELVELRPACVSAWAGENRERHDFRLGAVALEVKTSLRAEVGAPTVHVSSIDQLQPPSGGRLFLHALQLERADQGSISVASLVRRIECRLSASGLEHFQRGVASYTNDPPESPAFELLGRYTFEVTPTFSCLIPVRLAQGRLDAGVRNVEYDVELSAVRQFSVPFEVARDAFLSGG